MLIGKVGPANPNRCLQKTWSILTSTVIARGVTRKLLQEGQLRKALFCLELQGGQRNSTQCFEDQPPCLWLSCAQGGKPSRWRRVLVLQPRWETLMETKTGRMQSSPTGLCSSEQSLNMKYYFWIFRKKNVNLSLSWVNHLVFVNHLRSCFEVLVENRKDWNEVTDEWQMRLNCGTAKAGFNLIFTLLEL